MPEVPTLVSPSRPVAMSPVRNPSAMVLATSAGYVGLVVGVAVLELAGRMMNPDDPSSVMAPPFVSLTTAVVAAVAVAIGGGLSGLFPALHAARIRTVDALRDE